MKKFSFVYSIKNVVVSRTYGGSNYTAVVYQIADGIPVYIGQQRACTRGHKGEDSEAFTVIVRQCPNVIKTIKKRAKTILKKDGKNYAAETFLKGIDNSGGYYFYSFRELGLYLKQI